MALSSTSCKSVTTRISTEVANLKYKKMSKDRESGKAAWFLALHGSCREHRSLQMRIQGLIHHVAHSSTFLESNLFAIDSTSPKELANVALSRVMGLATNALLTFLWGSVRTSVSP